MYQKNEYSKQKTGYSPFEKSTFWNHRQWLSFGELNLSFFNNLKISSILKTLSEISWEENFSKYSVINSSLGIKSSIKVMTKERCDFFTFAWINSSLNWIMTLMKFFMQIWCFYKRDIYSTISELMELR